ncbi:MAG TPA: hypothetical protein VGG48_18530 [Rhizomicrobium sp.]|jgi:hypothetical protein
MLKPLLHWYLRRFEARYAYDATYLHELADLSLGAFWRFARVQMMLRWPAHAPRDAFLAAAISGALVEDCGPCVQIASDQAVEQGMKGETIKALLSGAPTDADAQLGFDYARALLKASDNLDDLRETITARWGQKALISLTYIAMAARNFPVLKRAMGHAKICQRVRIGDAEVTVLKAA